jgi:hypothetical protein
MCVRFLHNTLHQVVDQRDVAPMKIDVLHDIALLEIFDFYVDKGFAEVAAWYTLVHVCRKWRNLVFGSPLRLNLRLLCGDRTRVRDMLDIWPPLPIVMRVYNFEAWGADNMGATFELNDRIYQLCLTPIPNSHSKKVLAAIRQTFPLMVHLHLAFEDETALVDTDLLLGGSAPRLQHSS